MESYHSKYKHNSYCLCIPPLHVLHGKNQESKCRGCAYGKQGIRVELLKLTFLLHRCLFQPSVHLIIIV